MRLPKIKKCSRENRSFSLVFFLVVSSSRKNDLICDRDLLEGDEAGRVGGADTGAAVANGAVCDGELTKVVTDHLGLDLDLVELGAVVDTDDRADHLGDDDHLAQVRLDGLGLLTDHTLALGLPELLQQGPGGALLEESTLDRPAGLGSEQLDELVLGKVQELLQVNTTVGELLKHTTARLRLLTEKKESVEQRWRPAGQREGERGEKEGGTEWKCVWNVCGKRTKYIFPWARRFQRAQCVLDRPCILFKRVRSDNTGVHHKGGERVVEEVEVC